MTSLRTRKSHHFAVAVQTGSWPATRTELFEFDAAHAARSSTKNARVRVAARFSVTDLRPAAGGVCAAA